MSENESQPVSADAEIPEVQLCEGELEQVAGGTYIPPNPVTNWIVEKIVDIVY
jgi:hypothetical protein